jgi:hypothetical protein
MNIGMLWFDNDPKLNLDTKVERAVAYYRDKYGKTPTLCFVHPSMLPTATLAAKNGGSKENGIESNSRTERYVTAGVEVRSNRSVLPNHFWIGVNGVSKAEPEKA